VLLGVVGDVLADPLLAFAAQVSDGRLAEEIAPRLQLQPFEGVLLDLERQVP